MSEDYKFIEELNKFLELLIFVRTHRNIPSEDAVYFLRTEKGIIDLISLVEHNLMDEYNFFISVMEKENA